MKNIKLQNEQNHKESRNALPAQDTDQNKEENAQRDGSNTFLRDNKFTTQISKNIKAVGGLAT